MYIIVSCHVLQLKSGTKLEVASDLSLLLC